jgi:hypothetical protein
MIILAALLDDITDLPTLFSVFFPTDQVPDYSMAAVDIFFFLFALYDASVC